MTRRYRYQGPVNSSVTLKVDGKDVDVLLFRGKEIDLPEEHDYVKTLVALEHLAPVAPAQPAAPAQTAADTAAQPSVIDVTVQVGPATAQDTETAKTKGAK